MGQEKVWNILSEQWHQFRRHPTKEVKCFIEKYVKLDKKLKVLDIGCGNCRHLIPFTNCNCYGIDFSEKMLEKAKKHCSNVKLKKADMRKLPFKDNYFDVCLFVASLHHLENNREKALKEMYRVLKKDGIALVCVWNKWLVFFSQRKNRWGALKLLFSRNGGTVPWTYNRQVYQRYYYFFGYFELRKLLKKTGFKIIQSEIGKNLIFVVKKSI